MISETAFNILIDKKFEAHSLENPGIRLTFPLKCKICKVQLGKFAVTFFGPQKASVCHFQDRGKSHTELGN